ncbi:hypothetical protein GPECTOR_78g95 [Gonium pectorale]|uniref:Guanylate kinase-like domain-containing protein n=1 Tax=Gonium pectorale TaxID=33097 RepID=A0A150G228_GONPE|nr:hypothetical protein GPECTOR_78g95 [Gonium pectorale]|eukprot:KXZ43907.1 hypothetical protein GPECTOR_78g95 [Gonium pectorale]
MAEHGDKFGFSVSHTTRGPRPGELNGVHYHFTDRSSMEADVAAGLFLEHADVHGNMYGTSLAAVAAVGQSGRVAVLDIDVQYMDATVVPVLREALRSLNETRPADPLGFLAEYFLEARANGGRHPRGPGNGKMIG